MKKIILLLTIIGLSFGPCLPAAAASSSEPSVPELYRRSLPLLVLESGSTDPTPKAKAEAVLNYLQLMGGGPALTGTSRDSYLGSLEASITGNKPIQMVILGFPFKSGNLTKVLSTKFDMGDYLGLLRLEHIAYSIEKTLGVACEVHIINHEPYLAEVFLVPTSVLGVQLIDTREYESAFLKLIKTCPHLRVAADLSNDYQRVMNTKKASHTQSVREAILAETKLKPLFMGELENSTLTVKLYEKLEAKDIKSKSKKTEFLKQLRDQMVLAYELGVTVFREIVSTHSVYGSMLRLSVHGDATKIMMNFASIPGTSATHTCVSWHGALLCRRSASGVSFDLTQASKTAEAKLVEERINGVDLAYMLLEDKEKETEKQKEKAEENSKEDK